jgi:hypothetical protein
MVSFGSYESKLHISQHPKIKALMPPILTLSAMYCDWPHLNAALQVVDRKGGRISKKLWIDCNATAW